mmetsp:Transcript_56969/g.88667  ORF Transcript_56969/g.88667 Transcript_56969/m.88667 type:complete len:211 (-) Transcript_56969:445-1077(-)
MIQFREFVVQIRVAFVPYATLIHFVAIIGKDFVEILVRKIPDQLAKRCFPRPRAQVLVCISERNPNLRTSRIGTASCKSHRTNFDWYVWSLRVILDSFSLPLLPFAFLFRDSKLHQEIRYRAKQCRAIEILISDQFQKARRPIRCPIWVHFDFDHSWNFLLVDDLAMHVDKIVWIVCLFFCYFFVSHPSPCLLYVTQMRKLLFQIRISRF